MCFSHTALGQPQPLLSIPSPSGSSQTMSRVHIPSLTTWGLGKCLYFGVSQKYIFVQSAEEWCFFFFQRRLGVTALGVGDRERW